MANLHTVLDRVEWDSAVHRVTDLSVKPMADYYDNTAQTPMGNRDLTRVGCTWSEASFKTQVAGSGTAGTAPFDGDLLIACGLAEATVGGTSVTYAPSGTLAFTAVDLDAYIGNGLMVSCDDAVGTVDYEMVPGAPCIASWAFNGIYTAPTSASGVAALGTTASPPICKALTATVLAQTVNLKRVGISTNTKTSGPNKNIAGTNGISAPEITDFDVVWEATFEMGQPADYDWYAAALGETKVALSVVLGGTAGNICTFRSDGYVYDNIDWGEENQIHTITLKVRASQASGDTPLTIAYT